ncbi:MULTISPECIES: VanZ family protein [Microbacteriaceae]|uniref:VanZ family protein n=1 Tax=Microbacteriaceae TaxID=85023 RepID=UPI000367AD92|nr:MULTISPECIES: VanZ family protein [Microbacteriaceae]
MTASLSLRPTHPARTAPRSLPAVLFAVYLVLLVWAVLWKFHVPDFGGEGVRAVKLVPFVASEGFGVNRPSEMLANVALFVPFGVYLGVLAPRWRVWPVAVVAALTSCALEAAQYVLASGSSDVTDVILNTSGAVGGFLVLSLARWVSRGRAVSALYWLCFIVTVAAAVFGASLLGSPLHSLPPLHR